MQDSPVVLVVYNLDSGVLQSVHDYTTSRPESPGTGSGSLYSLTHSPVGMKKEWKRFIKELGFPVRSMDRDEFTREFGKMSMTFPVVLFKSGTMLSVLVSTEELGRCTDLSDLIPLVTGRLPQP